MTTTTAAGGAAGSPTSAAKTSRHRGVSWERPKQKWRAKIYANGKDRHLGLFDDEDERYGVPRDELRPIFVAGSFDWTHPFVQPDAAETQSSVDDRANSPAPEAIPEES